MPALVVVNIYSVLYYNTTDNVLSYELRLVAMHCMLLNKFSIAVVSPLIFYDR